MDSEGRASSVLRRTPRHVLALGGVHLPLAPFTWLLEVLMPAKVGHDPGLLAFFLKRRGALSKDSPSLTLMPGKSNPPLSHRSSLEERVEGDNSLWARAFPGHHLNLRSRRAVYGRGPRPSSARPGVKAMSGPDRGERHGGGLGPKPGRGQADGQEPIIGPAFELDREPGRGSHRPGDRSVRGATDSSAARRTRRPPTPRRQRVDRLVQRVLSTPLFAACVAAAATASRLQRSTRVPSGQRTRSVCTGTKRVTPSSAHFSTIQSPRSPSGAPHSSTRGALSAARARCATRTNTSGRTVSITSSATHPAPSLAVRRSPGFARTTRET